MFVDFVNASCNIIHAREHKYWCDTVTQEFRRGVAYYKGDSNIVVFIIWTAFSSVE